jgi:hypothetical protein
MNISKMILIAATLICSIAINGVCKQCDCLDSNGLSTGKSTRVCGTKDELHPLCKAHCDSDNYAVYG